MIKATHGHAAVDHGQTFLPMATCPRGVKVQLLNPGNVAVYGHYDGSPTWKGWAPLPRIPKEMR